MLKNKNSFVLFCPHIFTFYELCGQDENGKKIKMAAAATYGELKMWFLVQFPEIEKFGENVDKIIKETRKIRAEQKKSA